MCDDVTVVLVNPRPLSEDDSVADPQVGVRSMFLTADPAEWEALLAAGKPVAQRVTVIPIDPVMFAELEAAHAGRNAVIGAGVQAVGRS